MLDSIDSLRLSRFLLPLFAFFVVLDVLDLVTTFVAATSRLIFIEYNPLASPFFRSLPYGLLGASVLKALPAIPLLFMIQAKGQGKYEYESLLLRTASFIVLVSADIFLSGIVFGNNIPQLLKLL